MKIAVGADHAGFELKERLLSRLVREGHQVRDFGTHSLDSTDYPDYAAPVGQAVATGEVDLGLLVCGTGTGMAIAANKIPGVRAANAWNAEIARQARAHGNANVLALGARVVPAEVAEAALDAFLATPFEGGRHTRRVEKIQALEAERAGATP